MLSFDRLFYEKHQPLSESIKTREDYLGFHRSFRFFPLLLLLAFCFCGFDPLTVDKPLIICEQPQSVSSVPNASRFGIFDTRLWSGYNSCLDTLTTLLGTRPAYILWFLQIDDPFPVSLVAGNSALGIKTVISMNIKSTRILDTTRNNQLLQEISEGIWDSTFTAFAKQAASVSTPVYLRFGYEMNGDWFPWGKHPAEFIAAWNHAYRIFKLAGATNVEWVFSPGILYGNRSPELDLQPYYPGDSVVDIVGVDGYNFGNFIDPWGSQHYWQDFGTIFEKSLVALKTFGKPIWITEIGCPSDSRRPAWLNELFAFMDNNPCVETVFWFNAHKTYEPDFRIESDATSLEEMREWLK
jgi:mannan endo-1,4-beta-mannosidase